MKILVVDDEALARSRLVALIAEMDFSCELVGEAANGREALHLCEQVNPEIVLLDIRMPVMDGIETARELAKLGEPPAVIFTTAFEDHALEAFEVSAIDYLLKPVRGERLKASLEKTRAFTANRWQALESAMPEEQKRRSKICVKNRSELTLVPLSSIRCFKAEQKYVSILDGEREMLIEESLNSLEKEFQELFMRVHRNALVALRYIEALEKDHEGHAVLRLQGLEIPIEVSRRHLAEVRSFLATSIA